MTSRPAGKGATGVVAVAVAAALAACAATPQPAPSSPPPAPPVAQPAPQPARPAPQPTRSASPPSRHAGWIQIFDCSSANEAKSGESLRAWRSGGPEGATWNWYGSDLVCAVVVQADCDGKARADLRLGRGRAPVARAPIALSRQQVTKVALRVPAKTWERALERSKTLTYKKLTVAVQVKARCAGAPERRWSDSFVGGFAGGE
jgi:hypothetical protein